MRSVAERRKEAAELAPRCFSESIKTVLRGKELILQSSYQECISVPGVERIDLKNVGTMRN